MRLDIKVSTITAGAAVARKAEHRASLEFGRFGERVANVSVRIVERPAARGGRFHCGVAVRVIDDRGNGSLVLAHGEDDDLNRAVQVAVTRAGERTGGEITRIDEARRTRRKWAASSAAAQEIGT